VCDLGYLERGALEYHTVAGVGQRRSFRQGEF
jgi:hypothetical protein